MKLGKNSATNPPNLADDAPNAFAVEISCLKSFTLNLTAFQNVSLALADTKYFISNGNPLAVPKLKIEMYADFGFRPVYIKVTKVSKLNRKSAPCEESGKYSFEKCVKNWVSEVITNFQKH